MVQVWREKVSAKYSRCYPFNKTQIKDGWIVIMRKDGTIKARLEPYQPKTKKVAQ
jgi:hypothetical protein